MERWKEEWTGGKNGRRNETEKMERKTYRPPEGEMEEEEEEWKGLRRREGGRTEQMLEKEKVNRR